MAADAKQEAVTRLLKQRMSISDIARETGMTRPTVRKYAKNVPELYKFVSVQGPILEIQAEPGDNPREIVAYYGELERELEFLGERLEGKDKIYMFRDKKDST